MIHEVIRYYVLVKSDRDTRRTLKLITFIKGAGVRTDDGLFEESLRE